MTRMKALFVATILLVVGAQSPSRADDEVAAAERRANDIVLSPTA